MNLLELIQQGESKTLELKSRLPQHDQLAKTIMAFANTNTVARMGPAAMPVDRAQMLAGRNPGFCARWWDQPRFPGFCPPPLGARRSDGARAPSGLRLLLDARSEIRNCVARVFKELGCIEQWGSGILRTQSACRAADLSEPRIREKGDFVDVEFYRPVPDRTNAAPDTAELNQQPGQERPIRPDSDRFRPIPTDWSALHPDERQLMVHLSQVGTLTRKDAAALLQVGETKIKTLFNALIKNGFIERMGQGRATYYVIPKGKPE